MWIASLQVGDSCCLRTGADALFSTMEAYVAPLGWLLFAG